MIMWEIALELIKAVGIACCLLTGVACVLVVIGILVDLGESFRDPNWMKFGKPDIEIETERWEEEA